MNTKVIAARSPYYADIDRVAKKFKIPLSSVVNEALKSYVLPFSSINMDILDTLERPAAILCRNTCCFKCGKQCHIVDVYCIAACREQHETQTCDHLVVKACDGFTV
jgi:hypothetical protein